MYCVRFLLPSFQSQRKFSIPTGENTFSSLMSICPICLCLLCKKLKHRIQTCVSPRLPADSSCQQTKANRFSLSLKELELFLPLLPLLSAKDYTKQNLLLQKANNQILFSEGIGTLSSSSLLIEKQILCSAVSETGLYTATLSREKPPVDHCEVCTGLSYCSAGASLDEPRTESLAKCWCRSSEAMLGMLSPGKQTQLG